jgi:hypothetical protein
MGKLPYRFQAKLQKGLPKESHLLFGIGTARPRLAYCFRKPVARQLTVLPCEASLPAVLAIAVHGRFKMIPYRTIEYLDVIEQSTSVSAVYREQYLAR